MITGDAAGGLAAALWLGPRPRPVAFPVPVPFNIALACWTLLIHVFFWESLQRLQYISAAGDTAVNGIDLLKALTGFAWPILAGIVFWVLYPAVRELVKSRAFTLRVGGMELTVQQGLENIQADISDLRQQIIALQEQRQAAKALAAAPQPAPPSVMPPRSAAPKPLKRILWVDDKPTNNANYVAALKDKRIEVEQALSTHEAIEKLKSGAFDAVISDMARKEDGKWDYEAGLSLLSAMRNLQVHLPIFFFSASSSVALTKAKAEAAGAKIMTSSGTDLFRALRENGAEI